jgi:hypothetical protein
MDASWTAADRAADPGLWGYRAVDKHNIKSTRFEPTSQNAFQLHLIGKPHKDGMDIPMALLEQNEGDHSIVVVHEDLDYTAFYRLIGLTVGWSIIPAANC